jgi:hypothetical protein
MRDMRDMRLTHIAHYLQWFATYVIEREHAYICQDKKARVDSMTQGLKKQVPKKTPASTLTARRGLILVEQTKLVTLITPGVTDNSFTPDVQQCNQLIVLMLLQLGVRAGEF